MHKGRETPKDCPLRSRDFVTRRSLKRKGRSLFVGSSAQCVGPKRWAQASGSACDLGIRGPRPTPGSSAHRPLRGPGSRTPRGPYRPTTPYPLSAQIDETAGQGLVSRNKPNPPGVLSADNPLPPVGYARKDVPRGGCVAVGFCRGRGFGAVAEETLSRRRACMSSGEATGTLRTGGVVSVGLCAPEAGTGVQSPV